MLHETLATMARDEIKNGLAKCDERQKLMFKRMYSRDLEKPINQIVDDIPDDKLDWALEQVNRTVNNNFARQLSQEEKNGK